MDTLKFILILLIILFYLLFFCFLFSIYLKYKEKLNIQEENYKLFIQEEKTEKLEKIKKIEKIENNKYTYNNCLKKCSTDFCNEYHVQKIKYNLCKECKKDNKCYDQYKGICVDCRNKYTCEELYGCGNKYPPINLIENSCAKCWPHIENIY